MIQGSLKSKKTSKRVPYHAFKGLRVLAPMLASLMLAGCFSSSDESARALTDGASDEVDSGRLFQNANVSGGETEANGSLDRRVALVIGNGDYGGNIGKLSNPTNDAVDMAEALQRTGFEVQLLTNVGRDEMQRAVLEFDRNLRDSDVGLFYYAGHAVQVNGRNFMIPTGAKLDITSNREDAIADYVALETLEIDNVLGRMGNAETELSIVILDACRNNPFNQGSRSLSRGLAQTSAPRATFVAYATSPGNIAQDGAGENSPYTAAIVETLEVPGLKLEDVFKKVRQNVALQTDGKQIPWENSSVFGDFYFTDPAIVVPPKPVLTKDEYIEVQRLLARMGFHRGSITGVPDERTREAIIQWQTLHGLELNGEIVKAQIPFLRTDAVRVEANLDAKFEEPSETPVSVRFPAEEDDKKAPESSARTTLPDDPVEPKFPEKSAKPTFPDDVDKPALADDPVEATIRHDDALEVRPSKKPANAKNTKQPAKVEKPEEPSDKWTDFVIPPPPA